MAWKWVKLIANSEGDKRLIVQQTDNGLFSYTEERFFGPAEGDEGMWPDGFWTPTSRGGYYETADEAEIGARSDIDWLQHLS